MVRGLVAEVSHENFRYRSLKEQEASGGIQMSK